MSTRALAIATMAPAVTAGLSAHAASQVVHTVQHGVSSYFGTARANLHANERAPVFGNDPDASIDATDGDLPSQSLLRLDDLFGTGPGQSGPARAVESASMRLSVTSADSALCLHEMLAPWGEATEGWGSMGDDRQTDDHELAVQPLLELGSRAGSASIPAASPTLNVTLAGRRLQLGLTTGRGWALPPFMPDGTNGMDFATRQWTEVADRPLLTIVTTPIPEPGTWATTLAGTAELGSLAHRRR